MGAMQLAQLRGPRLEERLRRGGLASGGAENFATSGRLADLASSAHAVGQPLLVAARESRRVTDEPDVALHVWTLPACGPGVSSRGVEALQEEVDVGWPAHDLPVVAIPECEATQGATPFPARHLGQGGPHDRNQDHAAL